MDGDKLNRMAIREVVEMHRSALEKFPLKTNRCILPQEVNAMQQ